MATRTKTPTKRPVARKPKEAQLPAVIENPYRDAIAEKQSVTFQQFEADLGSGDTSQESFDKLVRKYGRSTAWIYIAINRIINATAQTQFRLVERDLRGEPDQVVGAEGDSLRTLLEKPNPWQSRFDFVEDAFLALETCGNCFIEKSSVDRQGRPRELYVLNPARVSIVPHPKRFIAGYLYWTNGRQIPIPADRVVRIVYGNPESDYYGMSPLTAARLASDMDRDAMEWNRGFLRRGGWPSGAITTDAAIDPKDLRRLKAQIKSQLGRGKETAGKLIVLSGGLKFDRISITPKDADWLDGRRMSRDEILAIFGVPFAAAGLFATEQTTARSAGVVQQVKNFYIFTIFPKLSKFLGALNRELAGAFGPRFSLVPDLRSVPAFQDDVDQEVQRARALATLVRAGVPLNMALKRLYPELPTVPWGDVWWAQDGLIPVTDASGPTVIPTNGNGTEDEDEEEPSKQDGLLGRLPPHLATPLRRLIGH